MSNYLKDLERRYEEACKRCDEIAENSNSSEGFMPIIKATQERDNLKKELDELKKL